MPIYDSQCQACGHVSELVISSSEVKDKHPCSECEEKEMIRVWKTMPGLTRASFIDSKKTARAKEVDVHKKIANLEVAKSDSKHEDRKDIQKEINTLKKL